MTRALGRAGDGGLGVAQEVGEDGAERVELDGKIEVELGEQQRGRASSRAPAAARLGLDAGDPARQRGGVEPRARAQPQERVERVGVRAAQAAIDRAELVAPVTRAARAASSSARARSRTSAPKTGSRASGRSGAPAPRAACSRRS